MALLALSKAYMLQPKHWGFTCRNLNLPGKKVLFVMLIVGQMFAPFSLLSPVFAETPPTTQTEKSMALMVNSVTLPTLQQTKESVQIPVSSISARSQQVTEQLYKKQGKLNINYAPAETAAYSGHTLKSRYKNKKVEWAPSVINELNYATDDGVQISLEVSNHENTSAEDNTFQSVVNTSRRRSATQLTIQDKSNTIADSKFTPDPQPTYFVQRPMSEKANASRKVAF